MTQELKLYLATGRVRIRHYGGGDTDHEVIRLVRANDPDEARLKFHTHYNSKTVEYSVYYFMIDGDVSEVIE